MRTRRAPRSGSRRDTSSSARTGYLTNIIIPAQLRPTAIADSFDTPHTLGYNVGVQRELATDMSIEADYFHRDIRNLLGVRNSNIAFESRVLGRRFLPPFTTGPDHHVRPLLRRRSTTR